MFDCHVHTSFSTDSRLLLEDAVKKADEKKIGLVVTEHMDLFYPAEGQFVFNPDKYFECYGKYRNDKLLLGVELGMQETCIGENRELVKNYAFDYVIGSVHLVGGEDIFRDGYYEGRTKKQAYSKYLLSMHRCIKEYDFIDSLGHIDYVCRYSPFEDRELYYEDYCDEIDEVLKELVSKGKSMEVNTKRFNDKSALKNLVTIYNRYYELGGRTVTLGSDAHNADAIGSNFKLARDIVENCRLKIVYYKERKLNYI